MKKKTDKPERKADRIGEGNAEGGRSKKAAANAAVFFKKNIYLILMIVCVLAIIAMIIVAAVYNSGNKEPTTDIGVINPNPDNPDDNKPDDEQKPEPTWTFAPMMPVDGTVSKAFIDDIPVMDATLNKVMMHLGVDITAAAGEQVKATFDGKVKSIDKEDDTYFGTVVEIDHGNGYVTKYKLLDNVSVNVGDSVKTGDVIGVVADGCYYECKEDSHIHVELLLNGEEADLMKYILDGDK